MPQRWLRRLQRRPLVSPPDTKSPPNRGSVYQQAAWAVRPRSGCQGQQVQFAMRLALGSANDSVGGPKNPGEEPPDSLELLIVLGDRRLPEPDSKRILGSTSCSVSSIELRAVSTRGSTVGEERASRTWGVPARREPDELSKAVLESSAAGSALGRRNGLNCAACQRGWALAVPGQNGPAGTIPRLPLPAGVNHAARKGAG